MDKLKKTAALILLLPFVVSVVSVAADAKRISGYRSLNKKPHGYKIVKRPVRAGKYSQRFEVRAGDCGVGKGWSDCATDRERSEITVKKNWRYGRNQWIAFSVFLPKDFKVSNRVRTTVGQIHQKGGPKSRAGGFRSFPPLIQMELYKNIYKVNVHQTSGKPGKVVDKAKFITLTSISSMRGKWTDVEINFDTSKGNETLRIYLNGKLLVSEENWINFKPDHYYFKYGIYRSFVSKHGGPMPTQILYIDEVRMGRSRKNVSVHSTRATD